MLVRKMFENQVREAFGDSVDFSHGTGGHSIVEILLHHERVRQTLLFQAEALLALLEVKKC